MGSRNKEIEEINKIHCCVSSGSLCSGPCSALQMIPARAGNQTERGGDPEPILKLMGKIFPSKMTVSTEYVQQQFLYNTVHTVCRQRPSHFHSKKDRHGMQTFEDLFLLCTGLRIEDEKKGRKIRTPPPHHHQTRVIRR